MRQVLRDLHERNWKPMYQHEPVGCVVLLLFDNGTIRYGYREEPTVTKYKPNTYLCEDTGLPFEEEPLYWDYK